MKVFKVMFDNVVVGIVVDKHGTLSPDAALQAWNNAQPSYGGDTAESAIFIEQ